MHILLTEGAGLTSRQVATLLDRQGHRVSVVVSDAICLARFTRHVSSLHIVPSFGESPLAWFEATLKVAKDEGVDVIFPTQEQVTVLSHQLPRLAEAGIATSVPPFTALQQVQDKLSALHTLEVLDIPQPHTVVVHETSEVATWESFPVFVKAPVGTGSAGVMCAHNVTELAAAVRHFIDDGALSDGGVLVQESVVGTFVMAQCVFDAGALVAFHANQRVQEGAKGSACNKLSLEVPVLRGLLAKLGGALNWHGALSVDAIIDNGQPYIIDVNPRLVEPGNAMASGTDLVGAMLDVALGRFANPAAHSRPGTRTHQLLMAILGQAQLTGRRRAVGREVFQAVTRRGVYAGSTEELCPMKGDWRTVLLPVAAFAATLIRPAWWKLFTDGAVSRYAISAEGWRSLRSTPELSAAAA
jgi:biotin carboxylase